MGDIVKSFLLRLPVVLHEQIKREAEESGVSMNEHCVARLGGGEMPVGAEAAPVLLHARSVLRDALVGIVIFGSVARNEVTSRSDVDLLVVIERNLAITRELYRQWDASPHTIDNRPVDSHFVHLPERRVGGGVWAEAAVDGLVVADRDRRIHRALAQIRGDMADGFLRRHAVHGQAYWTTAA